jgi:hypothetical protein
MLERVTHEAVCSGGQEYDVIKEKDEVYSEIAPPVKARGFTLAYCPAYSTPVPRVEEKIDKPAEYEMIQVNKPPT